MTKYRIRLRNGRVIGPFVKSQLFELKAKGHIQGQEEAQVFPVGDWLPLKDHDFYDDLMDPNKTVVESTKQDETFVIDLTKLRNERNQKDLDKLDVTSHRPIELTETVRIASSPSSAPSNASGQTSELELEIEPSQAFEAPNLKSNQDKTLINPVAQQELERLRREERVAREKSEAEDRRKKEEEEEHKRRAEEAKLIVQDESTQMIKLDSLGDDLLESAQLEEQKFELELVEIKKKRKLEEKEDDDQEDVEQLENKKSLKKKVLYGVIAIIFIYAIFFPDSGEEKKKPFVHVPVEISFPVPFDKADAQRSKLDYEKGVKAWAMGTYAGTISAGKFFKSAFENDMSNHKALGLMVRSYGQQLRSSKSKLSDSQTLFNIIQANRPYLSKDPDGVIGMNLFYMSIKKYDAAANVVAKYLKLYPKNVTQDLFAVYTKSLLKIGKIDLAKTFFKALSKASGKNQYGYEALISYSLINQENDDAINYLNEAMKKYPHLVTFYLQRADYHIKKNEVALVGDYLKKAEELNLEYNDLYRAKFLELQGLLYASRGDAKTATLIFKKSLQIEESPDLRMRLAELASSDDPKSETELLISESKAYKLLLQAQNFYDQKSYELAMSSAAKATDVFPDHIPSKLFLAKVQLRLGLAKYAIKTLEELLKRYPDNKAINFAVIDGYIETFKFNDARNRIAIISTSEMKQMPEFASANARLYIKMGDSLQAISWLRNSINLNPLNDQDIYLLAEMLIKRSNFDAARTLLNKCMELDPVNPDYHIAKAKILYEQQDDQAAVGYLLSLLEQTIREDVIDENGVTKTVERKVAGEFADNPKILAEIAIFYFRAGKVKDFQAYKEKIEKLPGKDKALYEFLVKAALLDEKYDEIPILVEKILKVEPGDIEAMMTAGKVLFENGKFSEASKWFLRIQQKMETYPKVQYYIAKIKYYAKDYDGAMTDVKKDLEANGENDADLALMGLIHSAKGEFVEAENAYKKAQKINPRSYDALMGLADISTKRNNFDLALDMYKKAHKEKGDEPVIHKKIGDVYRLLGQGALAVESYKLYLEMNPEASDKTQIESYINLMQ